MQLLQGFRRLTNSSRSSCPTESQMACMMYVILNRQKRGGMGDTYLASSLQYQLYPLVISFWNQAIFLTSGSWPSPQKSKIGSGARKYPVWDPPAKARHTKGDQTVEYRFVYRLKSGGQATAQNPEPAMWTSAPPRSHPALLC
eukprot:scaffold5_cov104-Skeletonema_dohrnii-CCMP3373.AAC.5